MASLSPAQIRAGRSMSGESQSELATRAKVTRSVLKLLESPDRKRPDILMIARVRSALEERGVEFLQATNEAGEGVRFKHPRETSIVQMIRHARALLDLSLDQTEAISGVGRDAIARIERGRLKREPEEGLRKLQGAIEARGVVFLAADESSGPGIRFQEKQF